jgi:hypothetical protein
MVSWTPRSPRLAVKVLCWLLAVEIALGFVAGGAGAILPLAFPMLTILALIIIPLATWLLTGPGARLPVGGLVLLGLVLIIPLLQLIPLPVGVWTGLPLRDRAVEMLQAAEAPLGPMPLSLSPARTWDSFLWLLPPTAIFLGVAALDLRQRLWIASVVIVVLIGSIGMAALQYTSGYQARFQVYKEIHLGIPIGFFANRNHQAAALSVGLPLIAAVTMIWRRSVKGQWTLPQLTFIGLMALFVVGAVVTTSRAGLALCGMGLMTCLAIYLLGPREERVLKGQPWWLLGMASLVIIIGQLGLGATLKRFEDIKDEGRLWIWPNVEKAIGGSFPWGTGLGSFRTVYPIYEPITNLSPAYVNEAHNEYLQLVLETGFVFPIMLAGFFAWVGLRLRASRRDPDWNQAALTWAAAASITILLVHSLFDYPMRGPSLGGLFALFCACLTAPQPRESARRSPAGRSRSDQAHAD